MMDGLHIGTKGEYDVVFFLFLCFFFNPHVKWAI